MRPAVTGIGRALLPIRMAVIGSALLGGALGLATLPAAHAWAASPEAGAAARAPRLAGLVEGKPVFADDLNDREIAEARGKLFDLESAKLREVALRRMRESRPKEFALPPFSVSDEEVQKLYEDANLSKRGTLEQLESQIRAHLEQQKRAEVDRQHYELALAKGYVQPLLIQPAEFEVELAEPVRPTSKGPADAPVQIVEFSDFQCPFCSRAQPTVRQVMEKYAGKVRLTYRHLPLTRIHPRAQELAEASECAAEQGKFWPFHDLIFGNFAEIDTLELDALAQQAGVRDGKRFLACRESRQYRSRVEEDARAAESLNIGGTPTFLIGRRTGTGTIRGALLEGAQPMSNFERAIDRILAQSGKP